MSEEWERNEDGSIKLQLVKSLLTVMELVEGEDPTRPGLVRVPLALWRSNLTMRNISAFDCNSDLVLKS